MDSIPIFEYTGIKKARIELLNAIEQIDEITTEGVVAAQFTALVHLQLALKSVLSAADALVQTYALVPCNPDSLPNCSENNV